MDSLWFILQTGISLVYLLYFFLISRLQISINSNDKKNKKFQPFASVIIASKNEALQLKKNLLPILQQEYHIKGVPQFEVVLVNDHSTDNSAEVLDELGSFFSHLRVIHFNKNKTSSKKRAITKGIDNAKGNYLVFTDADSQPTSNVWLFNMVQSLKNKKVILGYGGFYKDDTWLNKTQAYETFVTALQYLSFAKHATPYMGVGRNMAYQKELFTSNNGYQKHFNLLSGDDDLFIQDVATKENTGVCVAWESFTYSKAPSTWKAWLRQKNRHLSTSYKYKKEHQFILGSIAFVRFSYWIVSLLSLIIAFNFPLLLTFISLWGLVGMVLNHKLAHFKEKRLLFFLFILDAKLMLFHLILLLSSFQHKATSWK